MWKLFSLAVVGVILLGGIQSANATITGEKFAGQLLIDAPRVGDVWYVHPKTKERYYLGADVDAIATIQKLAIHISAKNLAKIPTVSEKVGGDAKLRKKSAGFFLMDMNSGGRLWYESPWLLKRKPIPADVQLQDTLRRFGVQGSNAALRRIPSAVDSLAGPEIPPQITAVKKVKVTTNRGVFLTTQLIIDRRNQHWQLITDTADPTDCVDNCAALSVRDFVRRQNGVAGIAGTYFCADTWGCQGGPNSYLWPVFNSSTRTMINQARMQFIYDPMVIIDTNKKPHYLAAGDEFGTLEEYERQNGLTVQAAISNSPAMVEEGVDILNTWALDDGQLYTQTTRTFFGWHGFYLYLVSVRSATMLDATAVATAMNLDYALNLDGGGSSGIYHDGSYVVGPGRNVPNAIVVVPK